MTPQRLSAMDEAMLKLESATTPMHVGWAMIFDPPESGRRITVEELREHLDGRLDRAPRCRQKLAMTPFDLAEPVWVDDKDFDIANHVNRIPTRGTVSRRRFQEIYAEQMSKPLDRSRPLWGYDMVYPLAGGRIGMVGRAHHCMVDGVSGIELVAVLMDLAPEVKDAEISAWEPEPEPSRAELLARGLLSRAREPVETAADLTRTVTSPSRMAGIAKGALKAPAMLLRELDTIAPTTPFEQPLSEARATAFFSTPLDAAKRAGRALGATVNDVILAATAGGVRRWMKEHGERPLDLKAAVPVSVRGSDDSVGNRISFIFVDLPVTETDPAKRLRAISAETTERKRAGDASTAEAMLNFLARGPHHLRAPMARLSMSPRFYNISVSNIPGPQFPLYMLGAKLSEAYPAVNLQPEHAVAVGITSVMGKLFWGLMADPNTIEDVDRLAGAIETSMKELIRMGERAE